MKPSADSRFAVNLRRITSGGDFIPEIDGFRLLAILVVVISHIYTQVALARGLAWPHFLIFPDRGTRGVFLFFTISGFILGLPFARAALQPGRKGRAFSYRSYLLRRLTRLEPPYVLTLLLRFVLLLGVLHVGTRGLVPHFAASLFYLHNAVFGFMSPVSPPTWSLEVEVQFYLLAPLLGAVFRIRSAALRRMLLVLATLVFAVAAQVFFGANQRYILSLAGNFQYFVAGLLLCDLYLLRPLPALSANVWDLAAICALVPLLWNDSRATIVFFPFGALMLYLGGFRGNLVRRFFAAPIVSVAGGMCYSIYLTHGTVLAFVAMIFARVHLAALSPVGQCLLVLSSSLLAVFLIGIAFFVVLERPCMDPQWPRKLGTTMLLIRRDASA